MRAFHADSIAYVVLSSCPDFFVGKQSAPKCNLRDNLGKMFCLRKDQFLANNNLAKTPKLTWDWFDTLASLRYLIVNVRGTGIFRTAPMVSEWSQIDRNSADSQWSRDWWSASCSLTPRMLKENYNDESCFECSRCCCHVVRRCWLG